ncbi:MAG: hypothetical protein COB35_10940 [Gammaproteobacteria bacterium]|nr:MAG: hypothetical protein COB35_10940 [Gammaproteobacteria bacterium]
MTITEEILSIANQLADQGKKPSVALIKTRLSQSVPLPMLISILKSWQHQPNYKPSSRSDAEENRKNNTGSNMIQLSKTELNTLIEHALAPIKQELAEIKQLVKKSLKQ